MCLPIVHNARCLETLQKEEEQKAGEKEKRYLVSLSLLGSRTRGSRNRELVKPGVPLSGKRIGEPGG